MEWIADEHSRNNTHVYPRTRLPLILALWFVLITCSSSRSSPSFNPAGCMPITITLAGYEWVGWMPLPTIVTTFLALAAGVITSDYIPHLPACLVWFFPIQTDGDDDLLCSRIRVIFLPPRARRLGSYGLMDDDGDVPGAKRGHGSFLQLARFLCPPPRDADTCTQRLPPPPSPSIHLASI